MKKTLHFAKFEGLGNDFVIIDARKEDLEGLDIAALAVKICDRHFGVGADGLILVLSSEKADHRMRIFNPDGSEPEMCGNGIRCFAKYIYDSSKEKKDVYSVETLAGIMVPALIIERGTAIGAEVDMGQPKLKRGDIPMAGKKNDEVINEPLKLNGQVVKVTCVSMGNPHCVVFCEELDSVNSADLGPRIEKHPSFPERTNVEFVEVIKENEIRMKVWERGAGETLACGTGAAASVVASVLNKKTGRRVLVRLPGGNLDIEWEVEDDHVALRGPARFVFEGAFHIEQEK